MSTCDCEVFQSCPKCAKDLSKPGPKPKKAKIWNKTVRTHDIESPKETHCRFCGEPDDDTSYFHHCEIPFLKMKYGSGVATKINDNLTAWGHHSCGTRMSKQPILGEVEHQQILEWENQWLLAIIETHLV